MFLKSLTHEGVQVLRRPHGARVRARDHRGGGPNGSGKSNVVDAVTWVLGAQGPRSLRSQKMEDVIFAGTSSRAALGPGRGLARPSTTLRAGCPVDMAEVTITRTLFRSGDSEYAINGDALPAARHPRAAERLGGRPPAAHDHRPGPAGHGAQRPPRGPAGHHRGGGRGAQAPPAPGAGRAAAGRRPRRTSSAWATWSGRCGARSARSSARPPRPARTPPWPRSCGPSASTWPATELAELAGRRTAAADALAALAAEERQLREALAALDEAATTTAAELSSSREEDLASALGRVQGLVERTRGTSGVLRERAGPWPPPSTPRPTSTWSPRSRPRGRAWPRSWPRPRRRPRRSTPSGPSWRRPRGPWPPTSGPTARAWGDGTEQAAAEDALSRCPEPTWSCCAGPSTRTAGHWPASTSGRPPWSGATTRSPRSTPSCSAGPRTSKPRPSGWPPRRRGRSRRRRGRVGRATEAEQAADAAEQQRHRSAPPGPKPWPGPSTSSRGPGAGRPSRGVGGGRLTGRPGGDRPGLGVGLRGGGRGVGGGRGGRRPRARPARRSARLHTKGATGALLAARPAPPRTPAGGLPAGAELLRPHVRVRSGGPAVVGSARRAARPGGAGGRLGGRHSTWRSTGPTWWW